MYYDIFILDCLMHKPHYGYEIKKILIEGFSICSNISNNTLYPVLKRFEKLGATEKTMEKVQGKPSRIVYSITNEGRLLFVKMLRDFPDSLLDNWDDFVMRLVFFKYIPEDKRKYILDYKQEKLETDLEKSKIILKSKEKNGPSLTSKYLVNQLKLQLELVSDFRREIKGPCLLSDKGEFSG